MKKTCKKLLIFVALLTGVCSFSGCFGNLESSDFPPVSEDKTEEQSIGPSIEQSIEPSEEQSEEPSFEQSQEQSIEPSEEQSEESSEQETSKFEFSEQDGYLILTGYTGTEKEVYIPGTVDGKEVRTIGDGVFKNTTVKKVSLPDTLQKFKETQSAIGVDAFSSDGGTLETIEYRGTIEEFIEKVNPKLPSFSGYLSYVQCTNGKWWVNITPIPED